MPRCTKRLSSPIASASQVRKAITSWRVSRSIASIRSMSAGPIAATFAPPFARIAFAAASGIAPTRAMPSAARASISNQIRKRFSGAQMAAISGLV